MKNNLNRILYFLKYINKYIINKRYNINSNIISSSDIKALSALFILDEVYAFTCGF